MSEQIWRQGDVAGVESPRTGSEPSRSTADWPPAHASTARPQSSLSLRLKRLVTVIVFCLRRSLIPATLVGLSVFAATTYMRVETADAKITLAHFKAETAMRLNQPGTTIPLTDKRGKHHRIEAGRLVAMPHVAALSDQTKDALWQNAYAALGVASLWVFFSTTITTRRIL